jgi:hypothetical protein
MQLKQKYQVQQSLKIIAALDVNINIVAYKI